MMANHKPAQPVMAVIATAEGMRSTAKHYSTQKVSQESGRLVPSSGQSVQIMDDHVLTTRTSSGDGGVTPNQRERAFRKPGLLTLFAAGLVDLDVWCVCARIDRVCVDSGSGKLS
ncbi:hypothetical protein FOPG_01871 [Fusarium oxysporum f. sp. conglutinans race 2 54008]|uniref:Uncharacterized protein n=1 Tax=Fusarium oxysporum f. sp. conglutinans race 2 54008 TaxID=1089457 RepID=X0IS61_FUSOX|nr:hypothetical protein FOPG_01871 [Fusarium oxysporum f. sp. conglutinans race 2 54008]